MKNQEQTGNLCQYAIPGKQYRKTFLYPYKCAVFYECKYIEPTEERTKWCTRKPIGDRKGIKKEDVLNRKIKRKRRRRMTEENYKELTAAVKESGIPLQMQKELQRLLDKEFIENEKLAKLHQCNGKEKNMREEKKEKLNILDFTPGNTVEFAGQKWNVLDQVEENKFLCVNNDIICEKEFDKENNNNWNKSSLREYLNGEYLQKFTDVKLEPWKQDLTTDDGLDDYGTSEDKIFLLTTDQYRKYRENMRDVKVWWWLITADSTINHLVRSVNTDGSLNGGNAYSGNSGVRPACVVYLLI